MFYDMGTSVLVGNLTEDPELRFTSNGTAVTNCRVARNMGENGAEFYTVNVWREMGEHAAQTLRKGKRAIFVGTWRQRAYTDATGVNRTVFEFNAQEVGPSLRWADHGVSQTPKVARQAAQPATEQAPPPEELTLGTNPDNDVPF